MAKLMEIIEKNPDFKKGTVSMRMLDTTFSQLTRKIGSQAGVDYKTVTKGQMLSKELLQSLNRDQLALKEKLLRWQHAYNTYIDSIKSKITDATHFDYVFTSLIDYSSKYAPNKTLADYYLFAEFVNAEKELYEFGHYWGREHMSDLLFKMKEWSKRKNYGSCVGEVALEFETRSTSTDWTITQKSGLTVRTNSGGDTHRHDKVWLYISGLQGMKIGESRTVKVNADTGGFGAITITRNSLNCDSQLNDDGYFTFNPWHSGLADGVRSWPRVTRWTEVGSTHFDVKKPTLPLMRKVKLL